MAVAPRPWGAGRAAMPLARARMVAVVVKVVVVKGFMLVRVVTV